MPHEHAVRLRRTAAKAHDDDGGQYLALLVDSEEEQDRYLVVQVDPESLQQFCSGALELRPLIAEASRNQWYLATATNLDGPLAIERQRMPAFSAGRGFHVG